MKLKKTSTAVNSLLEQNIDSKINQMKKDIVSELAKIIERNNEKINKVYADASNKSDDKHMSYAQAAKQSENRIIIKPKDKAKKNKQTKQVLRSVIEPTKGLVSAIREINSGGLIVQCKSKEALDQVQQKITEQIGNDYEMEKSIEKRDLRKTFKPCLQKLERSKKRHILDSDIRAILEPSRKRYFLDSDIRSLLELSKKRHFLDTF